MVERQNRTIKEKLLKVLEEEHRNDWPLALQGILFAHRTARHKSTGYSPFRILYGRDPVLPLDVKYDIVSHDEGESEFDEEYVRHVVQVMNGIRTEVNSTAQSNIKQAQSKQRDDYDRRHDSSHTYSVGEKVLLKNLKRADRKGGKYADPWRGPYTITATYDNKTCKLQNEKGELKTKQNLCNVKPYYDETSNQTNVGISQLTGTWLPQYQLTDEDKKSIINVEELSDSIINASQNILKQQFPVAGLDSSLLVQAGGFDAVADQAVQIHYDENRRHWVTSSTVRNRIELADSLSTGRISDSVSAQLKQRYATLTNDHKLSVYILPVQQQVNGVDCGCHAIATAVEFLVEEGNPTVDFSISCMRDHLIKCLEAGRFDAFPKCSKRRRGTKGKIIQVDI